LVGIHALVIKGVISIQVIAENRVFRAMN